MSGVPGVALQLYTVRDDAARDLLGTLDRVAEIGYDGVELAGLHGAASREVRERCADLGLEIVAAHVGLDRAERELDVVVDELRSLGVARLVIPSSPRGGDEAVVAARLSGAAAAARERGLDPLFHNHWWEFERVEGTRRWDAIVDVAGLDLELDLGWAWVSGEDPVLLLRTHAGRVPLVHVKDHVRRDGATPDCPVGDGDVGYERMIPVALESGVEWLIVEQDEPGDDPLEAITRSLRAVRAILVG